MVEVGMYVRIKEGVIFKILTKKTTSYGFCGETDSNIFEHLTYTYGKGYYLSNELKDKIVKYSYNIIDLIEIGDHVNGELVEDIAGEYLRVSGESHNKHYFNKQIKSIVTHEQFVRMSYKIGE